MAGGRHFLEHPRDPGVVPFPSFFDTPLVTSTEERTAARRAEVDQCMMGAPTKKATTISHTLVMDEEPPLCDGLHTHQPSHGVRPEGGLHSTSSSRYPPGMCRWLALLIVRTLERMRQNGTGPGGFSNQGTSTLRVTGWSRAATNSAQGLSVINEAFVNGRGTLLDDRNPAAYVHVDDDLFLTSALPQQYARCERQRRR